MATPYKRILVNFTKEFREAVWQAADNANMTYSEFVSLALEQAVQAQGINVKNEVRAKKGRPRKGSVTHAQSNH